MAIAAVTATLQSLISNRVAAEPIAPVIGAVSVTSLPPDRISLTGTNDPDQINLFLHQITRNQGWANVDLPSRNSRGERIANPPLTVDLHYLISVYGSSPYYAELLLGELMQVLHENPVLSRTTIETALSPTTPPTDFPTELADSGIADQIEKIRLTPGVLNAEEISKLWAAMQAKFRPTVAYQASTLIIENNAVAKPALPVARRLGYGMPLNSAVIQSIVVTDQPGEPVVPGVSVDIQGYRLENEHMVIIMNGSDVTALATEIGDTKITLLLPSPMVAGIYSGVVAVKIIHQMMMSDPESLHLGQESNTETFMLRPQVSTTVTVDDSELIEGVNYRSGTFTSTIDPRVARRQSVSLLLNEYQPPTTRSPRAYRIKAPDGNGLDSEIIDTDTVEFSFSSVAEGEYLVRVQVDGAESLLTTDTDGYFFQPRISL